MKNKLFVLIWLGLLAAGDAQAYVDPGTGMIVIQGVLAFVGGVVFFLRNPLRALRTLIDKLRKKRP